MRCPYQNFGCPFVDTSDMTKSVKCTECKYYDRGIRATGATPILAWILKKLGYKLKYEPTDEEKSGISKQIIIKRDDVDDLNNFMMGL
jgi:hypothetical protein